MKGRRFRKRHSFIQLELAGNLKTLFEFRNVHFLEYGFFFTNIVDLQAALSACVSVRESWLTAQVFRSVSQALNSTFNPRFAYKLQWKTPWDSSTIEITTIEVQSAN